MKPWGVGLEVPRQTERRAAPGGPHLKPLQEENKFHWSLKSLELISSSTFFLET